jgi:hypothetical protein
MQGKPAYRSTSYMCYQSLPVAPYPRMVVALLAQSTFETCLPKMIDVLVDGSSMCPKGKPEHAQTIRGRVQVLQMAVYSDTEVVFSLGAAVRSHSHVMSPNSLLVPLQALPTADRRSTFSGLCFLWAHAKNSLEANRIAHPYVIGALGRIEIVEKKVKTISLLPRHWPWAPVDSDLSLKDTILLHRRSVA